MRALEFTDKKVILEMTRDEFDDLTNAVDALVQEYDAFDPCIIETSFESINAINDKFYEMIGIDDDYLIKNNESENI